MLLRHEELCATTVGPRKIFARYLYNRKVQFVVLLINFINDYQVFFVLDVVGWRSSPAVDCIIQANTTICTVRPSNSTQKTDRHVTLTVNGECPGDNYKRSGNEVKLRKVDQGFEKRTVDVKVSSELVYSQTVAKHDKNILT